MNVVRAVESYAMFHEGTDMMKWREEAWYENGGKSEKRDRLSAPHFALRSSIPSSSQEMIDVWTMYDVCRRRRPHPLSMTSRGNLDPTID